MVCQKVCQPRCVTRLPYKDDLCVDRFVNQAVLRDYQTKMISVSTGLSTKLCYETRDKDNLCVDRFVNQAVLRD